MKLRGIDGLMLFLYLLIALFGIANVYSVDKGIGMKQFFWFGISLVLGFSTFMVRPKFFENFSGLFYLFGLILLAGLLPFGSVVNGAKAWYKLGPVSLQPVEFSKILTAMMLANYVATPSFNIKNSQSVMMSMLIIFVPIVLILLQPDVGSVLVFIAFFVALYREGLSGWLFIVGFYFAAIFLFSIRISPQMILAGLSGMVVVLLIVFRKRFPLKRLSNLFLVAFFIGISGAVSFASPFVFDKLPRHQRDRIMVLFEGEQKKEYRDGIGYNLLYSKTAIGSGGFWGKGYKEGSVTAGGFVPEQRTDFIFCTVGEEWGFVGSAVLLICYALFIGRIYYLAETQKSTFSRVFGYTLASVLLMHFLINIGMVTGLFPTVGIPLPFFSYGGSSLLAFSLFTLIFLRLNYADKNSLL
ncbi:MAG: rod shape-determining protein RodA [Flavobacteriaceae bacterium]|jgi:rod shape determining protein RodA|nr:rod shape-determining protein RodA [Flavobacteriaceae bacterium]